MMSVSVNTTIHTGVEFRPQQNCRQKHRPATIYPSVWSRLVRLLWVVPLIFVHCSVGHGQDQAGDGVKDEIQSFSGVVRDAQQNPAPALAIDFWQGEQKLGSAVTDDSGAFNVDLAIDDSAVDLPVQVSSESGHSQFSLSDNHANLALQLSETAGGSGAPTWVIAFFATILPIIVIAIVVMSIRNRRPRNLSD